VKPGKPGTSPPGGKDKLIQFLTHKLINKLTNFDTKVDTIRPLSFRFLQTLAYFLLRFLVLWWLVGYAQEWINVETEKFWFARLWISLSRFES
jgi:hypothetical protein